MRRITVREKYFKLAGSAALLSISFSLAAQTGPPVGYGQWSASGGVISDTACSDPNVTCTPIASGDGFRYELVETPIGQFSRMIMTEVGVTGNATTLDYSAETYAVMNTWGSGATFADVFLPGPNPNPLLNAISQGIASRQIIRDPNSAFETSTEIQTGFARDTKFFPSFSSPTDLINAWSIKIVQTDSSAGMDNGFSMIDYRGLTDPGAWGALTVLNSDERIGRIMDIWQTVTDTATGQQQKFDHRDRGGIAGYEWATNTGGQACVPDINAANCIQPKITTDNTATPLMINGTPVSWTVGQEVTATWIGGNMGGPVGVTRFTVRDVPTYVANTPRDYIGGPVVTTAREIHMANPNPADWQTGATADLNWKFNGTIPDPFATTNPRTQAPSFP